MKIIEPGKLPETTLRGRCSKCKCLVECDQSETTFERVDPREMGTAGRYVSCPTPRCDERIWMREIIPGL